VKLLFERWQHFLEGVRRGTISNREELIKYITQFPDQEIYLDNPKGTSKAFGGGKENKVKLPFDYGEYSDIINPADNMGWDVIVVPSADSETEYFLPVGHVSYIEGREDKAGNDKIILAPEGHYEREDKSIIDNFFDELPQFSNVVWY